MILGPTQLRQNVMGMIRIVLKVPIESSSKSRELVGRCFATIKVRNTFHITHPTPNLPLRITLVTTMVLKIYGELVASVQRIVCVLNEKDVPYEIVPTSIPKGEHKSPQYLEKQPFGQVPYIVS
jgi:hypothetical protein